MERTAEVTSGPGPSSAARASGEGPLGPPKAGTREERSLKQRASLLQTYKTAKLRIKDEPTGDEIKDYAETTMNELLSWYGYEHAVHKEDTQGLDLKRFNPAASHPLPAQPRGKVSSASSTSGSDHSGDRQREPPQRGDDNSTDTRGQHSDESCPSSKPHAVSSSHNLLPRRPGNMDADDRPATETRETMATTRDVIRPIEVRPLTSDDDDDEVDERSARGHGVKDDHDALLLSPSPSPSRADSTGPVTTETTPALSSRLPCLWCQKAAGDKPFSLTTDEGATKLFCSDLCFTLCRRASFKKNKVCDWCKNVKNTVSYVDFQDGEQQLQFCGDPCLNQYKMNIFCKETQEHLETIKSQLGGSSSGAPLPPATGDKQIIITPELWKGRGERRARGEERKHRLRAADRRPSETRPAATVTTAYKPRTEVNGDSLDAFSSNSDSREYLRSPKKELFSPTLYPRPGSKEGPKVTKDVRPRDSLPRDSLPYYTSSPGSELSSTPRSSVTTAAPGAPVSTPGILAQGIPTQGIPAPGLPASQLLNSLGPGGLPPWLYKPLIGYSGDAPEPRPPAPPLLGPASGLLGMPPLLPGPAQSVQGGILAASGLLPPSTLLVPYPVVVPLPVPLPIPIPIPLVAPATPTATSDQSQTPPQVKQETPDDPANHSSHHSDEPRACSHHGDDPQASDSIACACCSTTPPHYHDNVQHDAMDLSKDRRSKPCEARRGSPASSDGSAQRSADSAYSARRSRILDAPATPSDGPAPGDKRLYVGALGKEHAYGKRRCIRPRIRTK